ncbi:hypothetical protein L9F63_004211, partial [Diploptera punctata]
QAVPLAELTWWNFDACLFRIPSVFLMVFYRPSTSEPNCGVYSVSDNVRIENVPESKFDWNVDIDAIHLLDLHENSCFFVLIINYLFNFLHAYSKYEFCSTHTAKMLYFFFPIQKRFFGGHRGGTRSLWEKTMCPRMGKLGPFSGAKILQYTTVAYASKNKSCNRRYFSHMSLLIVVMLCIDIFSQKS